VIRKSNNNPGRKITSTFTLVADHSVEFIRDSACLAAQQTVLDQRLFLVSAEQYDALMDLLERPEQPNEGLSELFSRKAPWDRPCSEKAMEVLEQYAEDEAALTKT
jgi:uncharacterized protein (DUF1778 family)